MAIFVIINIEYERDGMMFQKRSYGFTLIELLAVIVILAVVMLIATPTILNIIEDAKKGSFKNSVYGIIKAAEYDNSRKIIKGQQITEVTYSYSNGVETSNPSGNKLEFKGTKPQNGTIIINEKGEVQLAIHDGKYCAKKRYKDKEVILFEQTLDDCFISYLDIVLDGNDPELDEGMIPIKWDGSKWVKADVRGKWYDYNAKEWANVVLVTEATRNSYKNASAGTIITETDVLAYLVWIPRYKYKLFNVEAAVISPKTIEIIFEDRTTTKSNGNNNGQWLTHPAFTFDNKEQAGFWVAKFETTGTTVTPTVKPGVASLTNQNISTYFTIARKFNTTVVYGLTNETDTHMMKNIDWGAVAYLTQSKYGKNVEVWKNPSIDYITGCAGISVNSGSTSGCSYHYTTSNGQEASTTGNIHGIYDMNGGAWEYVMGGMYNTDGTTIMLGSSGFDQTTIDSEDMNKYINKYAYGTTSSDYTRRQLGDATGEVQGWNNDSAYFVSSASSWFDRGGRYDDGSTSGMFRFHRGNGGASIGYSFRLVVFHK